MCRHIALAQHLGVADLEQCYRAAHEPHERRWWQILWLLAKGKTGTAIAESTGYTRVDWADRQALQRAGASGMLNR